jgi:hypothetical protein
MRLPAANRLQVMPQAAGYRGGTMPKTPIFRNPMSEEQPIAKNYPLSRIMHIIALVLSSILILVGIHILTKEEEFEYELYFYWFIACYVIVAMLVKMIMVVHGQHETKNIIIGFLVEFSFFVPIALNDWQTDKMEFTLAMLLTNVVRTAYYVMAVMKNSKLV